MEDARKKEAGPACTIVSLWPGESMMIEMFTEAGVKEMKVIAAQPLAGHCSRVARFIEGFYCPSRN